MVHLRSIRLPDTDTQPERFPFTVPVVRSFTEMQFTAPITFFVGENGSGKSTLLEAIAVGANLPTIGSQDTHNDITLDGIRQLSNRFKWVWNKSRVRTGFFMRSEDFFGFAKRISKLMGDMKNDYESDEGHEGQSEFARRLSKQAYANEMRAMRDLYGAGLDAQSHGESYFKLFRARFRPGGLYLMDEPEAPLSPNRQLMLIATLKEMIDQNAQFIIATHSPILLAYPNATIYNFTGGRIEQTDYDVLEHVQITRDFLNNPSAYLRHLLHDSQPD
ncbi:MAG: AAA family ATPase [Chloroflexota bacterium]